MKSPPRIKCATCAFFVSEEKSDVGNCYANPQIVARNKTSLCAFFKWPWMHEAEMREWLKMDDDHKRQTGPRSPS